jgi:hypothetical protein
MLWVPLSRPSIRVASRRLSSTVRTRRTSGSFRHVAQVSLRWSLVGRELSKCLAPPDQYRAPPQLYQPHYQAPPPVKYKHRRRTLQFHLGGEELLSL